MTIETKYRFCLIMHILMILMYITTIIQNSETRTRVHNESMRAIQAEREIIKLLRTQ